MAAFNAEEEAAATRAVVAGMVTQANAAIARLTDTATHWTYTALSAVSNLSLTDLTTASGTKPALLTLTLPTYTPVNVAAVAAPALPSAPSLAGGTTAMWNETFWTGLKSKLTLFTDSITGSDDIDSAVNRLTSEQDRMTSALYAKEYERKTQTLRDLYSAADAATGAAGFTYPNSMTTAIRLDAQQKYQFDLSETSRTLITHIFEWAKSNYQFSIDKTISAHGSDVEFNVRYLDTTIKAYSETVNSLLGKYREDVAVAVANADVKIREFLAQFNGELEKQKTLMDVQLRQAGFDVEVAKANALISGENLKIKLEDFKARVSSFLETAKVNLADRDANVKNQVTASQAAAQAALALASGASTITLNTGGA